MKISCQRIFISGVFLLLCFFQLNAQSSNDKTIIILLRHAEKDTSAAGSTMMQADPPLSKLGLQRTGKLLETLKEYRVDSIFSTNFNRTKNTVKPLATQFGIDINFYDPKNESVFVDRLKVIRGKTIVVVGHSNTIPGLVNQLIGSSKYANLNDNEYDKIWILSLEQGKYIEKQIQY